jgi:aryl-alcohol dehydrogenase-like predicted oxidoreductase
MAWINGIIIGVETLEQLKNNIDLFINTRLLTSDEILLVQNTFKNVNNTLTDPRLWNK